MFEMETKFEFDMIYELYILATFPGGGVCVRGDDALRGRLTDAVGTK